ncbi:FtsX-like permease family protein [Candidatus Woesearchaeota archaeon]|nr:FtsX-like permease family protein [Candidatus Woesearchaeota archaeon]
MIKEYLLLAARTIKERRIRSWLTMIGIFIGIAAVVALIGLGEGLRVTIRSQFGFLGTDVLSVQASGIGFAGPPGTGVVDPLTSDLVDKIEQIPNVEMALPRYLESGGLEYNDIQSIAYAMSIPSGEKRKLAYDTVNLDAEKGRMLKDGDNRRVVLGSSFAEDDNAFKEAIKVGDNLLFKGQKFQVIGILESKGSYLFDAAILMNEEVMLDILGTEKDEVNLIAVKVEDEQEMKKTREDIERLLRKERGVKKGEEDFTVETPQQSLESLNSTLFAVQLFVYIIAGISLMVGGIGIMNTMYTAVVERTKEIGIMKSIGARNSTIFTLFFMESGFMGMVGGIVGIIIGLMMAYGLAAAGRAALGVDIIQAHVSIFLILGSLLFSFAVGTFFGVLPAMQASKLNPVDSLRSAK